MTARVHRGVANILWRAQIDGGDAATIEKIRAEMSILFAADNPNFDRERFYRASTPVSATAPAD